MSLAERAVIFDPMSAKFAHYDREADIAWPPTGGSRDVVSEEAEWGLIDAPGGGIAGVYSRSEAKPLKTGNFAPPDVRFEGAERYSDWKFVFEPRSSVPSTQRAPQAK